MSIHKIESVPYDLVTEEGQDSARIVGGVNEVFNVTLAIDNINATTGFMIIDLSNTATWPHTETGHINIKWFQTNINPSLSPDFIGDISFGALQNVDASNGDLWVANKYTFTRKSDRIDLFKYFMGSHFCLDTVHFFGPKVVDDVTWQTDVPIVGPDGNSYSSGDGDMVVKVTVAAGSVDLNITVGYETIP